MIVLLIVAHALRHVQVERSQEPLAVQPVPSITPELLSELRTLLTSTSVSEGPTEAPQIAETTTATDAQETPPATLLLSVSEEVRNKVIEVYQQGIPRREICSYLRWGSASTRRL